MARGAAAPRGRGEEVRGVVRIMALVLLGLATVVAVALVGEGPSSPRTDGAGVDLARLLVALERGLLTVGVVLAALVAVAFVWVVVVGDAVPRDRPTGQLLRRVASFVLTVYLIAVLLGIVLPRLLGPAAGAPGDADLLDDAAGAAGGDAALWPVVVVLVAAGACLVVWWRLRPSTAVDDRGVTATARSVLAAAADRMEEGARVDDEVIAAYLRLEEAFADAGLQRAASETTGAYVDRVLRARVGDPAPLRELREVYERVRFGSGVSTRADALTARSALTRLLGHLDA